MERAAGPSYYFGGQQVGQLTLAGYVDQGKSGGVSWRPEPASTATQLNLLQPTSQYPAGATEFDLAKWNPRDRNTIVAMPRPVDMNDAMILPRINR
jgi:hypothetical protein